MSEEKRGIGPRQFCEWEGLGSQRFFYLLYLGVEDGESLLEQAVRDLPGITEVDVRPDRDIDERFMKASARASDIFLWVTKRGLNLLDIPLPTEEEVENIGFMNIVANKTKADRNISESIFGFIYQMMDGNELLAESIGLDQRPLLMDLARAGLLHCLMMLALNLDDESKAYYWGMAEYFGALEGLAAGWLTNGTTALELGIENNEAFVFRAMTRTDSIHRSGGRQMNHKMRFGRFFDPYNMLIIDHLKPELNLRTISQAAPVVVFQRPPEPPQPTH